MALMVIEIFTHVMCTDKVINLLKCAHQETAGNSRMHDIKRRTQSSDLDCWAAGSCCVIMIGCYHTVSDLLSTVLHQMRKVQEKSNPESRCAFRRDLGLALDLFLKLLLPS